MISDSGLFIHGCLVRRPVVGYLNRPEMASNRLCNTSIIITDSHDIHNVDDDQQVLTNARGLVFATFISFTRRHYHEIKHLWWNGTSHIANFAGVPYHKEHESYHYSS